MSVKTTILMDDPSKRTITYLITDHQVLLAYNKSGFSKGRWNGPGGKLKFGESPLQAAIRETKEEIAVTPKCLEKVAMVYFYFPHKPEWNHKVFVFLTRDWIGKPMETEEMRPKWFAISKIPYQEMWADDIHWLPYVLSGKKIRAKFEFDEKNSLTSFSVKILSSHQDSF